MRGEDHKLWDLLGESPRAKAPAFFASKVMRRAGLTRGGKRGWLTWWEHFEAVRREWAEVAAMASIVSIVALSVLSGGAGGAMDSMAGGSDEVSTLDLIELLSPEDHEILTRAGWPYDNGFLTAAL